MAGCLTWIHFGDLHVDEADGYEGLSQFRALAAVAQTHMGQPSEGGTVDFALLPGDNANHGTDDQYARIADAMTALTLPWHVLAGDHDFEPGDLTAMHAITTNLAPYAVTMHGYRCLFLDIVSAAWPQQEWPRLVIRVTNSQAPVTAQRIFSDGTTAT